MNSFSRMSLSDMTMRMLLTLPLMGMMVTAATNENDWTLQQGMEKLSRPVKEIITGDRRKGDPGMLGPVLDNALCRLVTGSRMKIKFQETYTAEVITSWYSRARGKGDDIVRQNQEEELDPRYKTAKDHFEGTYTQVNREIRYHDGEPKIWCTRLSQHNPRRAYGGPMMMLPKELRYHDDQEVGWGTKYIDSRESEHYLVLYDRGGQSIKSSGDQCEIHLKYVDLQNVKKKGKSYQLKALVCLKHYCRHRYKDPKLNKLPQPRSRNYTDPVMLETTITLEFLNEESGSLGEERPRSHEIGSGSNTKPVTNPDDEKINFTDFRKP